MIDLILFIYSFLPGVFVHILLALGCIGFVISSTPLMIPNKIVLKYTSIFIIALSLFLEGSLAVNNEYMERAKEWNHKIEIAEIRASEATSKIEYIVKDKIVEVEKRQLVYRDRIIKRSTDIDKECKIDTDTISILNDAARK